MASEWYLIRNDKVEPYPLFNDFADQYPGPVSHIGDPKCFGMRQLFALSKVNDDKRLKQILSAGDDVYAVDGKGRVWTASTGDLERVKGFQNIDWLYYSLGYLFALDKRGNVFRRGLYRTEKIRKDVRKISCCSRGVYFLHSDNTLSMFGKAKRTDLKVKDIFCNNIATLYIDMDDGLHLEPDGTDNSYLLFKGVKKMLCHVGVCYWTDMDDNLWSMTDRDGISKRDGMKVEDIRIDTGRLLVKAVLTPKESESTQS